MSLNQNYYTLWFESFYLHNASGHKGSVQLKLLAEQKVPREVELECKSRQVNPFSLLTECSKNYFYEYPVGTQFKLKAKLTDRQGRGMFFYSHFSWAPYEIIEPA